MKNKLLLTSALVGAVSLAGIAHSDVKVGGSHEETFAAGSTNGSGAASARGFGSETNLSVSGSKKLDNGLSLGLKFNLENDSSAKREYAITIGNDSVDVIFANDFTQDITLTAVPRVGDHPGTVAGRIFTALYQDSIGGAANERGQDQHVALQLKNVAGGNVVALWSPKQASAMDDAGTVNGTDTNGTGMAISYKGSPVQGLTVGLVRNVSEGANSSNVAADKKDKETLYTAGYSMGKFAIGAERRKFSDGASTKDMTGTYYGATFNVSDSLSVGLGYNVLSDDTSATAPDEKLKSIALGYNFGGLGIELSYVQVENASNATATTSDGEVVQLRTVVAF